MQETRARRGTWEVWGRSVVLLAGVVIAVVAGQGIAGERRYALAEHGFLVLQVPNDWKDAVGRANAMTPPTIAFGVESGEPFRVLVTPAWPMDAATKPPTSEEMRKAVLSAIEGAKGQAVEKNLQPAALKGPKASGWFFAATDRAPKPDEFKYIVQGMLGLDELRIGFTVLTNDGRRAVPGEALEMLRGASLEKAARRGPQTLKPKLAETQALRDLLDAGRFAELDAVLSGVQEDYRKGVIGDDVASWVFNRLGRLDADLRPLYDRWVAEKPQSYAAHLARARFLIPLAYSMRGGARAAKTSDAQFREMYRLMSEAMADLALAMKLDPYPVLALGNLIDVAQAAGDGQQSAAFAAEAMALDPAVYSVRADYLASIRPQWGGSLELMELALAQWKPSLREEQWTRLRRMTDNAKWQLVLVPAERLHEQKRYDEAIALYTRVIDEAPVARAYAMRGAAYSELKQYEKALPDLDRAVELDPYGECCSSARSNRARVLLRTGQIEKGMADMLMAAQNEDEFAIRELAVIYAFGRYGVKRDYVVARRWCERAAKQGDGLAMYCLGGILHAGLGVPKDAAGAAKWFKGAAERGIADAQADLGVMLWSGQGVAQDRAQAIRWWRTAALKGNKRAQAQLESKLSTLEYFREVTLPQWLGREI